MAKVLCYDKMSGRHFIMDPTVLDSVQKRLNKELVSRQYLSLNQVIDKINEELPDDRKLCLEPWGDLYGVAKTVGDLDFEFTTNSFVTEDGVALIEFNLEPAKEEMP